MWAVYSLLALLGLVLLAVLLLLFVPLGARIAYDGELQVRLRVLGIPITLLPAKKGDSSAEKPPPKPKKKAAGPSKGQQLKQELSTAFRQDGLGATLQYLGELARLAKSALGRLLHSITVDKLTLEMLLATGDAAETAKLYGTVCGAVYPLLAAVSGPLRIKKRALRIEPNFLLPQSGVQFDVRLHVRVYQAVAAALWLLLRYMTIRETTDIRTKEEANNGKSS